MKPIHTQADLDAVVAAFDPKKAGKSELLFTPREPIELLRPFTPIDEDWDEFHERIADMEGWEEPEEWIEECEEECDWINYGNNLVESSEYREWEYDRERFARKIAVERLVSRIIVRGDDRPLHPYWVQRLLWSSPEHLFVFESWGDWVLRSEKGDNQASDFGVLSPKGEWFPQHTGWNGRDIDPDTNEAYLVKVGRANSGRLLNGKEYLGQESKAELSAD